MAMNDMWRSFSIRKRPFLRRIVLHYLEYRRIGFGRIQAMRVAWFITQ
jgi:hypothetical protein